VSHTPFVRLFKGVLLENRELFIWAKQGVFVCECLCVYHYIFDLHIYSY